MKIFLPLLLSGLLLASYQYGFWLPRLLADAENEYQGAIKNHLDSVAEGLVPLILGRQLDAVYGTLDSLLKKHENWVSIELFDPQDRLLYPLDALTASKGHKDDDVRTFKQYIKYLDTNLGKLVVKVCLTEKLGVIRRDHTRLFYLFIIAISFFFLTTGFILELLVRKPNKQLAIASQEISRGNLEVNVDIKTKDEIAELALSFNKMTSYLKTAQDSLLNSNEKLEKEVAERTTEIQKTNRALQTVSRCREAIVHAKNEQALLDEVCRVMVEVGGYRFAWIGYAEHDEHKTVHPVAYAGHEEGYLQAITVRWDDSEFGRGPVGTAIREGRPAVFGDIADDPAFYPWREEARKRGYTSVVGLPLKMDSEIFGVLAIYAGVGNVFATAAAAETELLVELANDIAYGIESLRNGTSLKQSEEKYRKLVNEINEGLFITDETGSFIFSNRANAEMLGYENAEELAGKSLMDHIVVQERKSIAEIFKYLDRVKIPEIIETHMIKKDGSSAIFEVKATTIEKEGRIIGTRGVVSDITERKKAEDELMKLSLELEDRVLERTAQLDEAKQFMEKIIRNTFEGIITVDEECLVRSFNPAAERIFGYQSEEIVGEEIDRLAMGTFFTDDDDAVKNYLQQGRARIVDIVFKLGARRKNGEEFPAEVALSEMWLEDKRLYICLVSDITKRTEAERVKNEFISTVSHELRTPVTAIIGALGLVVGGATGELPERASALLDIAHKNGKRLIGLINDILDIQKIESGRMELGIEEIDPVLLAQKAVEAMGPYAHQFNVALRLESTLEEARVSADSGRLMQVMTNLLSNAVKYSPQNDIVVISVSEHDGNVRTAVTDHGPGIPDEFRSRIFQKFSQADSIISRQKGGTGLGLSIAKAIVELHGGRIGFESEPNVATTFWFELPIVGG